jgi:targeting protein for Xklp2
MAEAFSFNARQYFDFSQDQDDLNSDSYFDIQQESVATNGEPSVRPVLLEEVVETELSEPENDCFFSPMDNTGICGSTIYLRSKMRKSLSLNNLPTDDQLQKEEHGDSSLSSAMDDLNLSNHSQERPRSACSLKTSKAPSQEHINRLAQPKYFRSQDNLSKSKSMTLAEAVIKYQAGTPRRFRSKPSPRITKVAPFPWGGTKAHSPNLMTTKRVRPVTAISKEEQEQKEIEEARKFKIRAHPVNKKVLKGPLKPQLDKKPATVAEPFKLTEVKRKEEVENHKVPNFKAQPLPKSLHNPFKLKATAQPVTEAHTPKFSKRLNKSTPNKVEKQEKKETPAKPLKLTGTRPVPFSFEKRDQQLMKKKEEFINKVLEEEKKAREFHARRPPKAILRSRNGSQDEISESGSSRSFKRSTEDLNATVFKAKPATVLTKKPFEPKKDDNHVVTIEAFQFATDQRLEARHKFDQQLKEKEEQAAELKRQQEEALRRYQEEEVARLRREMEHKAQPIKKYKEVVIKSANKVTEPVSPKFHTDRIRNKENIEQ